MEQKTVSLSDPQTLKMNLVLCGSSRVPKSSISDLILGQREHSPESSSVCLRRKGEVCGRLITLVEMPALYNSQLSEEEVMRETFCCVSLCDPGVHAFLLIIPEGHITDEDKGETEKIQKIFGSRFNDHTIFLITTETQQEVLELDEDIRKFTETCRGGHYLFGPVPDVSGLIERVQQLVMENNGDLYTSLIAQHRRYNNQVTEIQTTIQNLERKITIHLEGADEDAVRIVLLGRSGAERSSTGNIILGKEDAFRSNMLQSVTAEVNGRHITVIDTPGLFDTQTDDVMDQKDSVITCISMAAPGPHVFLLVLKVGQRFSEEEKGAVEIIQKIFGERSVMYIMVLFTGDFLEKMTIEEYLGDPGPDVKSILEQCGNRYHFFNKETRDRTQVTALLEKIDSMVAMNGGTSYTTEMFQQEEKKEQERKLRKRVEEIEREKEELKDKYEVEIERMKKKLQEEIQTERKRRGEEFQKTVQQLRSEMKEINEHYKCRDNKRAEEDEKRRKDGEKMMMTQMEKQRAEFERQRHDDQTKSEQEEKKKVERERNERRECNEKHRKEREELECKIEELKKNVQNGESRIVEEEKRRHGLEERIQLLEEKRMKELEDLKKELEIRVQEEVKAKEQLLNEHQEEMERMRKRIEENRLKQREHHVKKKMDKMERNDSATETEITNLRAVTNPLLPHHDMNDTDSIQKEEKEKEEIDDLLGRLGLQDKYDTLTKAHFLEIIPSILQNEGPEEEKDLVHAFMQRLLTLDYRARHISVKAKPTDPNSQHTAGKGAYDGLFKKSTKHKEKKQVQIHPMDAQMAVFLRADHFLRQTMVTKLSQCQYAVPLLVPNPWSQDIEFPLWTMREISKSWKTTDTSGNVISKSLPMWKAETPMVAFFRLGSISSSKSQLINTLINERHDTFFHRDSPGSTKNCLLMDGVVEIAWYLPSGRSADHFSDCVAFCNLHGDSSTNEIQRRILMEMASVNVVLLPKLDQTDNNMVIVQDLCEDSKPLIVVITDEEEDDDDDEDVVCVIGERKYRVTLKGRNPSDVSAALKETIKNCLSQKPVTFKFDKMTNHPELKVDESSEVCKRRKEAAQQIMSLLESEDPSTVKEKYLSCQGKLWHDWCQKNKDLQRLQGNNLEKVKSRIEQEMREIRKKQKEHGFSELMGLFVGNLNSLSGCEKMYFLKWTKILLNEYTSDHLCSIYQDYDKKWAEVLDFKKKPYDNESKDLSSKQTKTEKLKAEQSELEKISNQLIEATFGLEHMLRETGQIYEASVSEKRDMKSNKGLSYLPDLAAELLISGHPVELMDGDAAHVPLIWVSAVLDEVIKKLGDLRVFVLSVLGIQSSGKSTMLNAMFGLQFAVSVGRCTRGAFMQLVKVSEEMKEEMKERMKEERKFDYILVVDTEGLRALEVAGRDTVHHDNEMATFVVGLGNMTLINIFGENPSEMQDILQIVVQAFMRMKKVRLNPSCVLVHQNVTDVTESEKIKEGRRRLQEKLDEMTKLAAKEEVCDAECFSDVIAFDVQNDVKYFAQLWEGSPPMAPPNPSYSENVQELKRDIVSRASKTNSMKLSQFQQRVKDLWDALLNENFVFSFRNSFEISVYRKLEEECEKWTWSLRSNMLSVEQTMFNRIAGGTVKTVQTQELIKEMSNTLKDVQTAFTAYFEKDSEKETLIQWKNRFETKIQNLHDELIDDAKRKLHDNIQQKNIPKNLDNQRVIHEKALLEKSKELALKLKEKRNEETNPKSEFDSMWRKWVSELTKDAPKLKDANISDDVFEVLGQFYESRVLQQKQSAEYREICITGNYQNYVFMKRKKISKVIPLWMKFLTEEDQRSIRELIYEVIQKTRQKVNSLPVSVQGYNKSYIQEIARDVKQTVQDFKPDQHSFQFKPEFFVDLSLYVFEEAEKRLAELHRKYREENDPLVYFEKKKPEYFKVFENYWQGAESEVLGEKSVVN